MSWWKKDTLVIMQQPEIEDIVEVMGSKNYTVYDKGKQPYNLNIFGIRSKDMTPNLFNDTLGVFYRDLNKKWRIHYWQATTDPGLYHLKHPSRTQGTAILVPGQYEGVYAIDKHNGKYDAICQRLGKVKVYRDANKDDRYDISDVTIEEDFFGINIHRASKIKRVARVDRYSAGCQVIRDSWDFSRLMSIATMARAFYGNKFTYTLLTEGDFDAQSKRDVLLPQM